MYIIFEKAPSPSQYLQYAEEMPSQISFDSLTLSLSLFSWRTACIHHDAGDWSRQSWGCRSRTPQCGRCPTMQRTVPPAWTWRLRWMMKEGNIAMHVMLKCRFLFSSKYPEFLQNTTFMPNSDKFEASYFVAIFPPRHPARSKFHSNTIHEGGRVSVVLRVLWRH